MKISAGYRPIVTVVMQLSKRFFLFKQQNKKDVATCAICNETFTTWKSYRHHVKNVHDTKEHVCWKCGTWFPGKDDLRLHVCPLKKVQSEADSTNGGPSAEKTQKEKVRIHGRIMLRV